MKADIILECDSDNDAEVLTAAISPDNVEAEPYLSVATEVYGNKILSHIECGNKMSTLTATIDDLLFCIATAERILKSVKTLNGTKMSNLARP